MWVFPFLHVTHRNPLTTFYQEWWSVLLGVVAFSVLLAGEGWQKLEIPRIVQLPVALIAVVVLQMALGMISYVGQGLLYIGYLLFAALLMMLGARLKDSFGIEKLALILASFLLLGAELNALAGVIQHYQWHLPLDWMVLHAITSAVYGNLAQANHFADYIALGLISLGLLWQQRRFSVGYVVLLATPLLFVMTLSGSRSSWLYLVVMSVLAAWNAWGKPQFRPFLYYCLSLLAGFTMMQWVVALPFIAVTESVNNLQRFSGADAAGGIRLYLWHEAWLMFSQSPWLGSGFGQFGWQHFQLGPTLQRTNIFGLYNNAHNLVFQLAAETGIAGLTVLFASMGVWLYGLRRATFHAAHWWGYAVMGVLAIHSMLEYPLWYAYFLGIAAVLMGALDETRYVPRLRNVAGIPVYRAGMATLLLFALLSLFQLRSGYRELEDALALRTSTMNDIESAQRFQESLHKLRGMPLLSPFAELYLSAFINVTGDGLRENLALNTRVAHTFPIEGVSYRQAMLLAQDGQLKQAEQEWEQAIWSYPFALDQRNRLEALAEKDPEHFSALLEFDLQKDQEHARAVYYK